MSEGQGCVCCMGGSLMWPQLDFPHSYIGAVYAEGKARLLCVGYSENASV